MAAAQSSFLDDLSWLTCTFCATSFSRQKQFLFLFCSKVACIDCALKMRSLSEPSKVDCSLCKKTVGLHQIRDDMPPNIRKMFQNTEKMVEEALQIFEFQQHLSAMSLANQEAKFDKMERDINDRAYRVQQNERAVQRDETEAARYATEITKVITDQRLQQLEQLSAEELESMSFDQLVGSGLRRGMSQSTSRSSSRHSRGSWSQSERQSESTFGFTQMMNELDFNEQGDAVRRSSRDGQDDLQRNSREGQCDVRRNSREGQSDLRRNSRERMPSHSNSSGHQSPQNAWKPQKIERRQGSRHSRHSRHSRKSRHSRGTNSDQRRSRESYERSRDGLHDEL